MIPFDSVESLLAIITSKCVDVFFVHNCCGKGALTNVHGREILPLIFLNAEHLTTIEENVLHSVVATHDIDEGSVDDSRMFLAHLVHTCSKHDFTLLI